MTTSIETKNSACRPENPFDNPVILAAISRALVSLTIAFALLTLMSINKLPDVVDNRSLSNFFLVFLKQGALGTVSLALPTFLMWAHWKDREQGYNSSRTWTFWLALVIGIVFLIGGVSAAKEIFIACKSLVIS